MGRLSRRILIAIEQGRFEISAHAAMRCAERGILPWQVVEGSRDGRIVRERPASKPRPSVILQLNLVDGSEVRAVWAWVEALQSAKRVTVFFDA